MISQKFQRKGGKKFLKAPVWLSEVLLQFFRRLLLSMLGDCTIVPSPVLFPSPSSLWSQTHGSWKIKFEKAEINTKPQRLMTVKQSTHKTTGILRSALKKLLSWAFLENSRSWKSNFPKSEGLRKSQMQSPQKAANHDLRNGGAEWKTKEMKLRDGTSCPSKPQANKQKTHHNSQTQPLQRQKLVCCGMKAFKKLNNKSFVNSR